MAKGFCGAPDEDLRDAVSTNTSNISALTNGLDNLLNISSRRTSQFTGDLNTINETSIYNCSDSTNQPSVGWGFVITLAHVNIGTYAIQIYIEMANSNHVYLRHNAGGTWSSWHQISFSS